MSIEAVEPGCFGSIGRTLTERWLTNAGSGAHSGVALCSIR